MPRATPYFPYETSTMWRFRGSPHYLDQQAKTAGNHPGSRRSRRHNPEIYRLAVLLAQLSERYHRVRRENGKPVFHTTELAQIKGTLEQCELELQKLHMLAAAADVMLDEAWRAFGFQDAQRLFEVTSDLGGLRHDRAALPRILRTGRTSLSSR